VTHLRIGLPSKGGLADQAAGLLTEAGLRFRRQDRNLFARVSGQPIDVTFVRTGDIPVLCAEGAIDLGITGSDVVAEAGVDLTPRLRLGFGACRMSVCVPEDSDIESVRDLDGLRIATSFPRLTEQFFRQQQASVRLVNISGSVEVMIALGVAEGVVDIVSTGSTLVANRLRVLTEIGRYEAVLVQNPQARCAEVADRVVRRLEGVVIARAWALLEYNVPRAQLATAEQITPGFNSPTVNALEDADWCAVQVMVERKDVIDVMDRLEAIGATAILQTDISNCRL
jgi:ATP phosphoribosyltransferase